MHARSTDTRVNLAERYLSGHRGSRGSIVLSLFVPPSPATLIRCFSFYPFFFLLFFVRFSSLASIESRGVDRLCENAMLSLIDNEES